MYFFIFCHIWLFFKILQHLLCSLPWKIITYGKNEKKALFNLPLCETHFSMTLLVPETRVSGSRSVNSSHDYSTWSLNSICKLYFRFLFNSMLGGKTGSIVLYNICEKSEQPCGKIGRTLINCQKLVIMQSNGFSKQFNAAFSSSRIQTKASLLRILNYMHTG